MDEFQIIPKTYNQMDHYVLFDENDFLRQIKLLEEFGEINYNDHINSSEKIEPEKIEPEKIKQDLKLKEENYECQCCYEKFSAKTMNKCSSYLAKFPHIFCNECIKRHIITLVGENKSDSRCMLSTNKGGCDGYMNFEKIKKLFISEQEKKLFNTFNEQIEKKTFIKIKLTCTDFYSCPFCNDYGIILENLEELKIKNLECPKCNKKSCLKCKRLEHGNLECIIFDTNTDNEKNKTRYSRRNF